jgi:heme-degrading monooxygenase HmoA
MIVTVFRSRLRDDARGEYMALAPRMSELASGMPGYLSHKTFVAEDGERVTIVEFKDQDSQRAWATQAEHVAAKKRGREAFYAEYSIQVCEVVRESRHAAPPASRQAQRVPGCHGVE